MKKKCKFTALLLASFIILSGTVPTGISGNWPSIGGPVLAAETGMVYDGDARAAAVLGNLKYSDVSSGNVWSRDAIYETGALGIITGLGGTAGRFGRATVLTKEEAIAVAYRAAGREAEAQELGVALNNARTAGNKKTDSLEVLYDGFIQLAANEGLITEQNLTDALNSDQAALTSDSFKRKAAAQRQEMAYWLARALNIKPVAQQQELQNFSDWRSIDPDKLSYMEAIVRLGILSGSGGRIQPTQSITREQGAQIVKNAQSFVLEALKYTKITGTVNQIDTIKDYTGDVTVSERKISVSNHNGSTAAIVTSVPAGTSSGAKNENSGTAAAASKNELVVYKNGTLGDSSLLKKGDRIQYIVDSTNTVKYVVVLSNINETRYMASQVNQVDQLNRLINVTQLFEMNEPDIKSISGDVSFSASANEKTTYRVATDAVIKVNGTAATLADVSDDATAILTIGSNHIVSEIQCVDFGINTEARRIVRGIVEENNPDLGYITLYNEDGSGTGSKNAAVLRTYNYVDQNNTEIYRNHKAVKADSIQTGDTAYIKLDNNGDIASISAVDNYTVRYGRVVSKYTNYIVVEFDDGTQQVLAAGNDVVVVRDKLLVGMKALEDGDRVRLLLNENGKTTELKEITIEGDEHYISNIYKGTITKIDTMSDKITVMGLQSFNKGNWERTDRKGTTTIPIAADFSIYANDTPLDIEQANKLLYANEAYIAVEKSYGGEEQAVLLSYRDSQDTVVPTVSDSLTGIVSGSGRFTLSREDKKVRYTAGSIVVKYGRLVTGNSLSNNDEAYLTLNREYSSGDYYASVIKVDEPQKANTLVLYRGRIKAINEEKDFIVESFSRLDGTNWTYSNTPKTFQITFDTRVLNDDGVLNVRDFKGYGSDSYLNRTVYVVADGTNAVLVSTAPYGTINLKGSVYAASDGVLELRNVQTYNLSSYLWSGSANASINILDNTVIMKGNKVISGSDIQKGDSVRILMKDAVSAGDGYIIFVE